MKRKHASLVKIVVIYPSPEFPDVQETIFREFVDATPRHELTNQVLQQYREIPDAMIDCVFCDVPPKMRAAVPTHWPQTAALN